MQPLSPLDAIGPAFNRARSLLLRDFHLRRFLKVALVAALTEGMSGAGFNYSGPMRGGNRLPSLPSLTPEQLHFALIAAVIVAIVFVPLGLLLTYLSSRFTFVTFDMVLMQRPFVRPGWELFRRAGNRYFGLRIVLALFSLAVVLVALVALFPGIQIAYHGGGWSHLLATLFALAPIFLLYLLVMLLFRCFLSTMVVPRMALEDSAITDSLKDGWSDLRSNFGNFLVYFLLRGALSIGIVIIAILAVLLCVVIVALVIGAVIFGLHHLLWAGGFLGKATVVSVGVVFGLALFAAYLAALISLAGFRNIFRESYAILFYGGYYPPLGNLLDPANAPTQMPAATTFVPTPDMPPPQAIW